MPDNLTQEQDLAVNLKRHISVKANAGSGKTKVLVDRYIRILEDSYTITDIAKTTPYEIVAMTFTRKAAGEMLKKVVDKIDELKTQLPPPDSKILTAYGKIRNDLNAARISTIHSFASSILRDFAVEANINPNFVELTDSNRHRIKTEAFEFVLTTIYQDKDSDLYKELISFINRYGIKTLEDNTNTLSNSKEFLKSLNISGFYDSTKEEILKIYQSAIMEFLITELNQIFHFTNLAFQCTSDNDKPLYLTKSENFSSLYNTYQSNKNHTIDDLANYMDVLIDIYTATPGVKGKTGLPNYFESQRSESMNYDFAGIPKFLKDNKFNPDDLINSTFIQIQDAKFLLTFANKVQEKTEEEKQKYSCLDYDDILIKTDELLSNPEVAQIISSKIKYIMVDEFQDTNPTQYSILKKIVPGLFNNQLHYPTSPEVFIVGDEKQSIYGFRGADVSIIKEATKMIEEHQQHREDDYRLRKRFPNAKPAELSGNIELNASFRMKPALALFTNAIFSKLMSKPISGQSNGKTNPNEKYRANYSNIVCGKSAGESEEPYYKVLQKNNSLIASNDKIDFGTVEFLISENNYIYETKAISDSILNLLQSGKYQAGDICILSRDKVHIKELSNELSNRKIPYFIHSGSGFYQSTEVLDVLSILSFLSDTKNDFELVSALKSPFFGLRDSDILILTNTEKVGASLWEKLIEFSNNSDLNNDAISRFQKAANLINYLLRVAYRMSIPKLIRTLLKESNWQSKITPFKDKDQRVANIYKLIDFAREFEKQGFTGIYDFVKELETLEEISKDGEAGINNENAVNIMTIHSAKGLEFPVVYLYDTNRNLLQKSNTMGFFLDTDFGITFKNASLINNRFFAKVDNMPLKLAKKKSLEMSIYEEIRLLYVAITRAIDKLYISASMIEFEKKTDEIKYKIDNNSYISMIMESLPYFPAATDLTESSFVLTHNSLDFLTNNSIEQVNNISLPITYKVVTSEEETSDDANQLVQTSINKHHYSSAELDDVMGNERDIFFSASKLSTFQKDKKRFWLEYILEMDDFLLKKSLDKFKTKETSGLHGQEIGTAIHGVFEKMNRWYDFDNNMIKIDELQSVITEALTLIDSVGNEKIEKRIKDEVNNVMSTTLIRNKEFDFKTMKNEFALRYAFGRDFLSGVIDILIKDTIGNYEIWDFKSDYLTKDGIISKAQNYEEQIKLYAYLIYLLTDKPALIKARLLFTRLAHPMAMHYEWTHLFTWSAKEMEEYKIELEKRIKEIYTEYEL
jgi:ATP-dependent helicase/nuclease subunit A